MKGLKIINKTNINKTIVSSSLEILLHLDNMEVMIHRLYCDASIWLEPASDPKVIEFFYVLRGRIKLFYNDEQGYHEEQLAVGDSFSAQGISENVNIIALEDGELLYVINNNIYDELFDFQEQLVMLMNQIDLRDKYTKEHCQRVRHYASMMWSEYAKKNLINFSNLVIAAQFHDIGKCLVDDEVLKLYDEFATPEEEAASRRHVEEGAILLGQMYNNETAAIVLDHHERLDGSGYLCKKGEELSKSVCLLAIADVFDKMTTHPIASKRSGYLEAAQEIVNEPTKFDHELALVLLHLVENDTINADCHQFIERKENNGTKK